MSVVAESPGSNQTVPHLEVTGWLDRFGLVAGITTSGPAGDYSLGLWSGTAPVAEAMTRWTAFRHAFGPGFHTVALSRQVHGAKVRWHPEAGEGWLLLEGYDGHATPSAGILLAVSVADCVPVYLADRQGRAQGLLHAGWRGIAAGVLEAGVEEFSTHAAVSPSDIVMHCGISICGSCYEVGPEVILNVAGRVVDRPEPLDLRAELRRRAEQLGVGEVTLSPYCTAHDEGMFHSHRASRGWAGRMIAYVGRPAP